MGQTKVYTSATDALCKDLGDLQCRAANKSAVDLAAGFTRESGTDVTCKALAANKCRAADKFTQTDMGQTKAYTSATDALCKDLAATECRKADKSASTLDVKFTRTSGTDVTCVAVTDAQCIEST